ncbi:RHS repeat-associated core domain-containing protein [Pseudoxanthomonas spadix]|nr:RHS repeat-associated core domain-containing protein [Pseudoxanthomonas spadix]MBP3973144.1 hypothetical protein [Pseudoxanthomonas spadix]RMW97279.1 hypothetical protein D9R12_03985 [Pseudoxanthomonas spadix]
MRVVWSAEATRSLRQIFTCIAQDSPMAARTFDYGNRLRDVPGKESYRYDAQGRRVLGQRNGGLMLSQYSSAGQLMYEERSGKGNFEHIYLGGSLLATRNSGVIKYQHTDALGSPVAVTDTAAQVIERTQYEPYGAAIGKTVDGVGYTGHVMDGPTGLTYMQQRYYDPSIGRFLSVDPVTAYSNPVGAFNRYWYANNNPYKFTDPDGRFVQALWGAPVGAIVEIAAQKIANPGQPINWRSVGVSAAVGAVSGGVASVARVAAIRGTVTVGKAVTATNAAVGAAGSAMDSAVNGESISAGKMALAAATNGGLSLAAGLAEAKGVLAEKMASGSPTSPQGIGDHILRTTQSAGGSTASTSAVQGAASAGGRVVDIAKETAVSAAQKKAEERIK